MKALLDRLLDRETIGHPDCPLMLRWTFWDRFGFKAMVHYFPAHTDDKDPHDHPRSFLTFVLKGSYIDTEWRPVPFAVRHREAGLLPPAQIKVEEVKAPTIRFRPAEYMHVTETGPSDCWTLVLMGPLRRPWGFLREGKKWWPWERYIEKFGGTVRCDTDDGDRSHELDRSAKRARYKSTPPPETEL